VISTIKTRRSPLNDRLRDLKKRKDWDGLIREMRRQSLLKRYYSVSFGYEGPLINIPDESQRCRLADKALTTAIQIAERVVEDLGGETSPEYAWPDGTFYLFLKIPFEKTKVLRLLQETLPEGVWVRHVVEKAPEHLTFRREVPICSLFLNL